MKKGSPGSAGCNLGRDLRGGFDCLGVELNGDG
jgi:hypothetical protein